ncbi:hypothetical protein CSUB01_09031 [Colletotrichum sublineola]|uniref:Uncharacterized protein n=1 Tax=Colletotrichum sublineola TaxID=1173701 RepID=A0A066WVJ3_COLSU|nr:hypothetical protein CSUB01_09031 [Colletotrichum sublineola]
MAQPAAKRRCTAPEDSNNYSESVDILLETIETDDLLRQCTDIVGQIEMVKLLRLKNSLSREDNHFLRECHNWLLEINNDIRKILNTSRQIVTNIRNEGLAQSHSQPSSVKGVAQAPQMSELLSGDQSHLLEKILQAIQLANDLSRQNNDLLSQNNNLLRQIEMNTRKKKGVRG